MRRKQVETAPARRRAFTEEFKQEAVQMLLDGHSAQSVVERLGLSGTNVWKANCSGCSGSATS